LREYGGNVSRAAAVLGLSRMQLHRKIREYDIH
jgi:transcriptional regulator of acetoin/glycerol metabolism